MEKRDRVTLLESNLERQLHWIQTADNKAAFAFGMSAAMLGLLAAIAPNSTREWATIPAVLASFAVVLNVAALLFLSFATFPRTTGPKGSLIYCGTIAERNVDQFSDAIRSLSADEYLLDLSAQCHRNAEIAALKFKWAQRAMLALYFAIAPWVVALWLLYDALGQQSST